MIKDLKQRSTLPEKMDEQGVNVKDIHRALAELEHINLFLGGYNVILTALNQLPWNDTPLRIVDVGCGGGDVLRKISAWAAANNRKVDLIGVDINPEMTAFAEKKAPGFKNIQFKTLDVWSGDLTKLKADVIISSLFCHHFNDDTLSLLVKQMYKASAKAVIINDLHRHWFAYHSIKWITTLFSKTYLVKYDAPLSVARSLTRKEWESTLLKAGIYNYTIKWMWAWRWQIIITKHE